MRIPIGTNTTPQPRTLGGFAQNIERDITQNIIPGFTALPGVLTQLLAPIASARPRETLGLLGKMGTGIAERYKGLVKEPGKRLYEEPVGTALDVLTIFQLLKGLSSAGRAGQPVRVAEEIAIPAQLPKIAPVTKVTAGIAKPSIATKALNLGAEIYKNAFNVPQRLAQELKPAETMKQIMQYRIFGGFEQLKSIAETVTGRNGVLSKAVRSAIGAIEKEVPIGSIESSVANLAKRFHAVEGKVKQDILMNINETLQPGRKMLHTRADDLYDAMRSFEQLGDEYFPLEPKKDFANRQIAEMYFSAADEARNILEKAVKDAGVIPQVVDESVLGPIREISPIFAERVQQAKTLSDLRSLQAPFVRLNRMINWTDLTGSTQRFNQSVARIAGAMAGGSIAGGLGAAAGVVAAPIVEPILGAAI